MHVVVAFGAGMLVCMFTEYGVSLHGHGGTMPSSVAYDGRTYNEISQPKERHANHEMQP